MVKKAHLVTGKGGVGKSLFSAVLAHYFSRKNRRVLLAELTEHSFYKDYLNLSQISYQPMPIELGVTPEQSALEISQWSPEDCLKEYSLHLLKIESLYRLFFENPVSRSLIQVAPGLPELALLGKLTSSPRRHGPPMGQDAVVVDSFASGHFLSLLRAPAAMATAISFGPMGEQSRSIDRLIRDVDFLQIHIVCLPEELPVTETIELYRQLESEFSVKPLVYLNKMSGLTESDLQELSPDHREELQLNLQNENWSKKTLQNEKIPFTELPLVPSLDVNTLIQALSQKLTGMA